ncbi:hypothetical protein QTG54_007420 [Skeletonema marinoi]|uniref:Solute-binding protein family 3/N-terminal domain-containing protein n=1 Tax=Skeletonema marinoi TaxID=267567 RepID=A0AAD8YAC3_9STRA|nr:hypothetical protein QTG54_007420 [Skeletonema marinoi]
MAQTTSSVALFYTLVACLKVATVTAVKTITLGQDIDYPPYAFQTADGELAGFGKDFADGMSAMCEDIDIKVVKESWANCWSSEGGGRLGAKLANASDTSLDGCMTYTHGQGVRDTFADFTDAMLNDNKAAGLLTLLDSDGKPKVTGLSDLSGKTLIDVGGWAPTSDGLSIVTNKCTSEKYSPDYEVVVANGDIANDVAMQMLRDGEGDAIFIYADQVEEYSACPAGSTWNCTLWEGFGTEVAYVQTGQFGHAMNGTTLSLSRKGSGIRELLRPCMQSFMLTKEYYDICVKHDLAGVCYANEFFGDDATVGGKYDLPTNKQTGDCSDGYCPCPVTSDDSPPVAGAPLETDPTSGSTTVLVGTSLLMTSSIMWLSASLM